MGLTLKSIQQFASDLQAGIVALTTAFTDWTPGSPELALTESFATQYGFLQKQAQDALAYARFGTTQTDTDADSYVADYVPYGFTARLPATYCSDVAVFGRNQASSTPQVLLVGVVIQNPTPSPSSAIQYQVVADTTNPAYSANAGGPGIAGYTLAAGLTQFAQAPKVQAVDAGSGSRVVAGTLTVIATAGVPFDTVTNPNAIQNGNDKETTLAMRARFAKWATGIGGGTTAAMGGAILAVQTGITYTINGGLNAADAAQVPFFTVVVDDGSGAIPAATLTAVTAAVDGKRAPGMPRAVIPPTAVPLTINVNGTSWQSGFDPVAGRAAIQAALIAFVKQNGVGGANAANNYTPALKFSYVALVNEVASFIGSGAGQGLAGYASITLDGGTSDVALTTYQLATASAGTVVVS